MKAPEVQPQTYVKVGNRWYYVESVAPSAGKRMLKDDGTSWVYNASTVDTKGKEAVVPLHHDGTEYPVQQHQPIAFRRIKYSRSS